MAEKDASRQLAPAPERRAVAQDAGLADEQGRNAKVVDCRLAAEAALMGGDTLAVLAHHDPVGMGMHLDRTVSGLEARP